MYEQNMPKVFFARSVSARDFTVAECAFILTVLNDPRAWPVGLWQPTSNAREALWSVTLESQKYIDTYAGKSVGPGLSVTFMNMRPRTSMLSYENWSIVPQPVRNTYTLAQYRQYLVLHECGHGLGLDHPRLSRKSTGPAPIMMQHTKGLHSYRPNLWPLSTEIAKLK